MASWSIRNEAGEAFITEVREHPERVLIALDFDGTLAPIVADPQDSRMHERSAEALGRLVGRLAGAAIITGRNVDTLRCLARLDERPDLTGLVVLGGYGAQRWVVGTAAGERPPRPTAIEAALPLLREAVAGCGVDGVALEDKGQAIGVHTRRSSDPDVAYRRLLPTLRDIAAPLGLTLEPGRSVIELRTSSVTKGDALANLVADTGARSAAMCGDDLGDLPAFEALVTLRDRGLTTCRVVSSSPEQGAMDTHADILADGPDGVADWLTFLASQQPD